MVEGREKEVPIEEVAVGNVMVVRPGEKIPTDGIIVKGESAIEASDVTLVSGSLSGVVSAIKLSRATFRKIKQNLLWAFGYNTAAIPLAVLGLLHPVIAEA